MSSIKCERCGLLNWAEAEACKRCGATLGGEATGIGGRSGESSGGRSIIRSAAAVLGAVLFILLIWYVSLLATSEPLTIEQKQTVDRAIDALEQKGFEKNGFILRHLVNYRATDNWWNRWVGHSDAYAATNFPFEVVTLYPDFFRFPVDDVERAAILLHESYHLMGQGEPKAFAGVWQNKKKLGWTEDIYGKTRVWKNVSELTRHYAPQFFRCGPDNQSDCTEE